MKLGTPNSFSCVIDGMPVTISHYILPIKLRATFGTSHKISTSRTNSLIKITIGDSLIGFGEIGMPPKCPGCYLADPSDINNYINELALYIAHAPIPITLKPILEIPIPDYIKMLFYYIDSCTGNEKDYSKAARNGLEAALFDIIGKITTTPVYSILFRVPVSPPPAKPCFYSLGMGPESEIRPNIEFALKHTDYIKVKLDTNIGRAVKMFSILNEICNKQKNYSGKWSADMNGCGNIPCALELLEKVFKNYKTRFYMLEQPFPIKVKAEDIKNWVKVKEAYEKEGFYIYADESVSDYKSISPIQDFVSGVNVKLEKCGGFRGAMLCIEEAQRLGLKIWIGIMVGTSVLSTMAAMLSLAGEYDDCAGDLLISPESDVLEAGFNWDKENNVLRLKGGYGLGLKNI